MKFIKIKNEYGNIGFFNLDQLVSVIELPAELHQTVITFNSQHGDYYVVYGDINEVISKINHINIFFNTMSDVEYDFEIVKDIEE